MSYLTFLRLKNTFFKQIINKSSDYTLVVSLSYFQHLMKYFLGKEFN